MFWLIGTLFFSLSFGELVVDYSAISGPVATIYMGTPPQSVRLALCFQTTESMIFRESICPIGQRFDSRASQSFSPLQYMSHSLPLFGLKAHRLVSESVSVGSSEAFTQRFMEIDAMIPSTANYKDVAGVLNLGKISPYMANHIASITGSARGGSFVIRQEPVGSVSDNVLWSPLIERNAPGYTFQSTFVSIGPVSV